jgi:hypothetical protein
MFWAKKKEKKTIRDPIAKYGEMIRNNKVPESKDSKKPCLLGKLFRAGCDSSFVYYED